MAIPPGHSQSVLPNPQLLRLESVQRDQGGFTLEVSSRYSPHCPDCGKRSHSFHSSYQRQLQDLPWQGLSVRLRLRVRRFRCRNPSCARKIFVERLPEVARAYARQTDRLREIIRCVGFVTGGLPGSRLLARLAIAVSDDTVLRCLKLPPVADAELEPVHCLGVDDWAWHKGQQYGTILVDLERHCVLDLLPERSATSFAAWLARHPTVSVISRDRCGLYAEGAQLGLPDAQQVADRFHLLLNLSTAVERALEEQSSRLRVSVPQPNPPPTAGNGPPALTRPQRLKQEHRQRRLELYQKVVQLYREGNSQRRIGQLLPIQRKTVRRWLRAGEFPERKVAVRKPAQVHAFAAYLEQRWSEGCHNATQLFREIRAQGYRGQRGMVAEFLSGWRSSSPLVAASAPQKMAPRSVAVLITRTPDQLTEQQRLVLDQLSFHCPDLVAIRTLTLSFRAALSSQDGQQMRDWIRLAKHSGIPPLVRFAFGLQRDLSAVLAAVNTPWSNGQVEGQINRLKMIKRQMYGRAGLRLLHARLLPYQPLANGSLQRAP